jgi:hypothetical protein
MDSSRAWITSIPGTSFKSICWLLTRILFLSGPLTDFHDGKTKSVNGTTLDLYVYHIAPLRAFLAFKKISIDGEMRMM